MPNLMQLKGAQPGKPTRYAPLWTGRFFSGIITQRSPLRGNITRTEEAYFGARGDEMLSGLNTEISPKLTLIRRPGLTVYNSSAMPAINRFYEFRTLVNNTESIKVLADVAPPTPSLGGSVRDVTGPSTNSVLWYKTGLPAASGITSFQSVGDTLYASDLTSSHKWLMSPVSWTASTSFNQDQFVVDSNGNLELNIGSQTATIINIQIQNDVVTLFFSPSTPLTVPPGASLTLTGLTTVPALNGQVLIVTSASNTLQITASFTNADVAFSPETGSATTGNGITGGILPTWGLTLGDITVDGGAQWENRGSAIQNWGITPPANAPSVTQVAAPSVYPSWSLNTWYAPLFVIQSGANLFQLTTAGMTGGSMPIWNTTPGFTTADGSAVWTCVGPASWAATTTYAVGSMVQPTFTYYITVTVENPGCFSLNTKLRDGKQIGDVEVGDLVWNGNQRARVRAIYDHDYIGDLYCMGDDEWVTPEHLMKDGKGWRPASEIFEEQKQFSGKVRTLEIDSEDFDEQAFELNNGYFAHNKQAGGGTYTYQQAVTATCLFQCTTAGTSGGTTPSWTNGLNTTVSDGTVVWVNKGKAPAWPGATQTLSLATEILDTNNNIQTVQTFGESGATHPAWLTTGGSTTLDNTTSWLYSGSFGAANTGAWIYAYSWENSVSGAISTASPESQPITQNAGQQVVIQGAGSSDSQVDTIVLWRTVQGGSTLFYLGSIPNPGSGTWIYTDTTPDTALNILIEAPIDETNNPPPVGLQALTYHLQRIWGAVGNLVYYSDGPDVISGNGNEAWSPGNVFAYPETVIRLFPTSSGLIVFTLSDIYIIQGLGISSSPLTSLPLLKDVGLSSYDAFDVNGSIVYMYTSDNQIVSLDPSSGVSEIGFVIGDQFGPGNGTNTFTPTSAHLTWHIAGSKDKGLYVSDFYGNWWRMSPTSSPETGNTWSPIANFIPSLAGFSAVQSVETSPGTHTLLVGPPTTGTGLIMKRDYSVHADNGVAYNANAVIGSLVLAQPGQIALVESLTTDSVAIGTPISLAVQLDEIAPISSGYFEGLLNYSPDPTELSPSNSVYAQRFYLSQTQQPALCRHLQVEVNFGKDTVQNELLSMTLFGGFEQEK